MLGLRYNSNFQHYRHTLLLQIRCVHSQSFHSLYLNFHRHGLVLSAPWQPQKRSASLTGWLRQNRPVIPTPSPQAVAEISRLENKADADPLDVLSHVELFDHLVRTGTKSGLSIVMNRWERMCEFGPSLPLLHSDDAFRLYLTALIKSGNELSVNFAVKRREMLLASHPIISTDAKPTSGEALPSVMDQEKLSSPRPMYDSPLTSFRPSSSTVSSTSPITAASSSRQIAEILLTNQSANGVPASPASMPHFKNDSQTRFSAALATGSGIKDNPIHVTINEPRGAALQRFLRFFVMTAMGGFFLLVLLAVLLENSGLVKAGPRQAEFEPTQIKAVKFSDVHGVDEVKEELQEVVAFLKDPSQFTKLGGKLPKGVLLTGEPGTGKTMLARAVAGEAGVPFLFASGSEFDEMFVGVGAKRVRDLFAKARAKQPAIVFIDEIDAIGGKRNSRDQQYLKQTLNQLLVEMDGFVQSEGVVVIAATNFPESLDQALVRPGRFDRIIAVPLPDVRGRVQILQHHMQNVITSPDVDAMILARGTPGFSGADLQNMVNQAAVQASRDGSAEVTLKHFESAKDRIIMGAERKTHYIDPKVKKLTAYHEGGHALVAMYTDGAMPLHKVTCVTRGHALGLTAQLPKDDRVSISKKEYLADIDVLMGGRVAEELIYGSDNVTSGASSDLRKATSVAQSMVRLWGYSDKVGPVWYPTNDNSISPQRRTEIENEVRRLLEEGSSRARALLKSKEDELHKLAAALVEHETLDLVQVQKVIRGEVIGPVEETIPQVHLNSEQNRVDGGLDTHPEPLASIP